MKKRRKPLIGPDGEVRELTKADMARMRPAIEVVPQVVEAWRRARGRPPKESTKQQVTLRLSPEVLDYFRKQGRGWQTRIDEVLSRHVARKKAA
ncbi:MAG: BrnA antitoxin family protein [Pseudomonadota bacterium]